MSTNLTPPLLDTGPETDVTNKPRSQWPQGMIAPGNINLWDRPTVHNPDGSISSVRSMSFDDAGKEVLVPTVSDDGRIMSNDEAITQYRETGRHLGIFQDAGMLHGWQHADNYATNLHNDYAAGKYGIGRSGGENVGPQRTPFNRTVPKSSSTKKMLPSAPR